MSAIAIPFLQAMQQGFPNVCRERDFVVTYSANKCGGECCQRQKIVRGLSYQDARNVFQRKMPLAWVLRVDTAS